MPRKEQHTQRPRLTCVQQPSQPLISWRPARGSEAFETPSRSSAPAARELPGNDPGSSNPVPENRLTPGRMLKVAGRLHGAITLLFEKRIFSE